MNDQDSDDGWSFLISGDSNDCNGESESNAAEGMADFFGSNHFSEESEDNPGFGDAVGSNGDVNVDSLDINSGDAMGDLLGLTANTDDQHSDGNPATRCDNVVSRGRGRPKGSRGNKLLRKKIHEKQEEARVQEEACQPQPGTIEYARMCKADIKKQKTIADSQQALCDTSDVTPCRMLATTSPVWQVWTRIGSHLQKMIALSAKETILNQRLAEDFQEPVIRYMLNERAHVISDSALASVVHVDKSEVKDRLLEGGAAIVEGGTMLWGAFNHCLSVKLASGEWTGLMLIKKMKYDETPSQVTVSSTVGNLPPTREASKTAKVFQLEYSISFLIREEETGKVLNFMGQVPTALRCVDRTTAETTKRAILETAASVPELDMLSNFFRIRLQMAVADRYRANAKAEKSILYDSLDKGPSSKVTLPCDVHKGASVAKTALNIADDVSWFFEDYSNYCMVCFSMKCQLFEPYEYDPFQNRKETPETCDGNLPW